MRKRLWLCSLLLALPAAADTSSGLPVDVSELRDSEKAAFERFVDKYPSACGKAHSLRTSLKSDPKCKRSVYAARYLARLLGLHLLNSEVEEIYDRRFGSVERAKIDVADSPVRGVANAPIAIVEFSDFQCPHCKKAAPILERIVEEYHGQVKLIFKNYPIPRAHPHAEIAAQAAMAAGKQGKFWQFHDRLFGGDQDRLDLPVLEGYAKALKLDLKKWKSDLDGMKDRVARDRADGEKADIMSTPSIFINGRLYRGPLTYDEIKDWVDEEINK